MVSFTWYKNDNVKETIEARVANVDTGCIYE
jgi:hypothetical protein